jgi:hypothetical protein
MFIKNAVGACFRKDIPSYGSTKIPDFIRNNAVSIACLSLSSIGIGGRSLFLIHDSLCIVIINPFLNFSGTQKGYKMDALSFKGQAMLIYAGNELSGGRRE